MARGKTPRDEQRQAGGTGILHGVPELSRRQFLAGLAAATGAIAIGGCGDSSSGQSDPESAPLPDPGASGIEHVVVVMMENRSFDHFLGWLPGADGMQAGLKFVDKQGASHPTFPLAPNFQNCQFDDPDHSYDGGRTQFDGGANDGWLRASTNDVFPIGYYTQNDLSFYGGAVPAWTTFDRYFAGILGPTYPNRFYMHAAETDRLSNTFDLATVPTIWDRLADKGLSGTYYYSDLPFLALWGSRYTPISKTIDVFFADAAAGNLPNVSYVDPRFIGEDQGTSNDDHPLADIRNGQAFVSRIYDAVTSSPNWPDTVLIFNYDEWGGFFDHVSPPLAPLTDLDPALGNDGRLGFRVPCLMVSPLARRGFVGHKQYDHTSILSLIEWRWSLDSLSARDATANNIAHALDFGSAKNLTAPHFSVPQGPFGEVCSPSAAESRPEFAGLRPLAEASGFLLPTR
ncbi:MAG TPA: alkaline phosphatase family protein [Candidatus Bathyarchaeia archaeon]|nr:alkaline phosphatase family protein [Candidatus Bathyarchaeia archaeon]